MNNKLTYRYKYYILIALLLLFVVIIYKLSINKTIILVRDTKDIKAQIDISNSSISIIKQLENELAYYDQLINENSNPGQAREYLLKVTGDYCDKNNLTVVDFPEETRYRQNEATIAFNEITIEGKYKELLGLLYLIERERQAGSVESVAFFREEKLRTNEQILYMKIIVKSILNENET